MLQNLPSAHIPLSFSVVLFHFLQGTLARISPPVLYSGALCLPKSSGTQLA